MIRARFIIVRRNVAYSSPALVCVVGGLVSLPDQLVKGLKGGILSGRIDPSFCNPATDALKIGSPFHRPHGVLVP